MGAIVRDKFRRHAKYRERLLATGHKALVYLNDHRDQYWGAVEKDKGSNHYGRILGEVRTECRAGRDVEAWVNSHVDLEADANCRWSVVVDRAGQPLPEDNVTVEGQATVLCGKLSSCDVKAEHPYVWTLNLMLLCRSCVEIRNLLCAYVRWYSPLQHACP